MTPEERQNPSIINGARRLRSPAVAARRTTEVNDLLDRFKADAGLHAPDGHMPGLSGRVVRRAGTGSKKSNKKKKRR